MQQEQIITQAATCDDYAQAVRAQLDDAGAHKVLVVCGKHTDDGLLTSLFGEAGYVRFSGFSPNPKMEQVLEGLDICTSNECDLLFAIGGGSAIDVAKGIKWQLNQNGVAPEELPPLWATPTTAGTGSESTPFAVVYVDGKKNSLDEPWLRPNIAFLCGELIMSVPAYHRNSAFMDAFCQAVESWWSAKATPESIELSKQAIDLLLTYGYDYIDPQVEIIEVQPRAGVDDEAKLEAANKTLLGANFAGRAIAITRTTAAHAMSYAVTSELGYAHGHAVALCFWQVMKTHGNLAAIDVECADLRATLEDMCAVMDVDKPGHLYQFAEGMIRYLGLEFPEISPELAADLASRVNVQRLSNNPIQFTSEHIAQMYLDMVEPEVTEENEERVRFNVYHTARMGRWLLAHKMNWIDTQKIQRYSIEVLRDVDKCCQDLGIRYFMAEGALLGAMRHGGPIPWDDDIDIGLLREDYDRFIKEAPAYLGDKYIIDTYETNPNHWTISGKVQMAQSVGYMRLKTQGLSLSNAPFVDLFAFDESPIGPDDDPEIAKEQKLRPLAVRGRYISGMRRLLFYKTGFSTNPKRKKLAQQVISPFTPVPWLHDRIDNGCRRYQGKDCRYVTNFGSMYKAKRETFPVDWILPLRRVKYGDMEVNVPNRAEDVLERIYGNWQGMPPYKARRGKHGFVREENYEEELEKYKQNVQERAERKKQAAKEQSREKRRDVIRNIGKRQSRKR